MVEKHLPSFAKSAVAPGTVPIAKDHIWAFFALLRQVLDFCLRKRPVLWRFGDFGEGVRADVSKACFIAYMKVARIYRSVMFDDQMLAARSAERALCWCAANDLRYDGIEKPYGYFMRIMQYPFVEKACKESSPFLAGDCIARSGAFDVLVEARLEVVPEVPVYLSWTGNVGF